MRKCLNLLIISFCCYLPTVQSDTVSRAYYITVDQSKEHPVLEAWEARDTAKNETLYHIKKQSSEGDTSETFETEVVDRFSTKGFGNKYYIEYRYNKHPLLLKDDERSFGYIETRSSLPGTVIARWPMFYSVSYVSDTMRKFSMVAYQEDGGQYIVNKYYRYNMFHFPEIIERLILSFNFKEGTFTTVTSSFTKKVIRY